MSIRMRCSGCRRKMSVDDAFAGGACRCPYCRAIVLVGGRPRESDAERPYAPLSRPDNPDEPLVEVVEEPTAAEPPMADPVRVQGWVTLVLMFLIVGMIAGAVWLGVALSNRKPAPAEVPSSGGDSGGAPQASPLPSAVPRTNPSAPVAENPFKAAAPGPTAAGVPIAPPVVYCLDCGGSMKNVFDYARYMTRLSVISLGPQQKFNIVLASEGGEKSLAADYRSGGRAGDANAREFLSAASPVGTADLSRALSGAIARGPRTIVLMCRGEVSGAEALGRKAKAAGIVIVAVGMACDSAAEKTLSALAAATGGHCRVLSESALSVWAESAPPLE